ncbi:hypothetical protein HPB52_000742 [Rhipicephalus sanguineus]|uniref:Uncharacterized protein n=1 Tax=Rhipicephalus sanguineus TaxID=34632 RepID=A0A9D4SRA8_RHISA|nr:hypothetical protein HPB52_000742 [Rhipicephalus sanguineus]
MAGRKRGPRFKDADEPRRKKSRVSVLDRARIVDVYRRGGDLTKQLAEALGIDIKNSKIDCSYRQTNIIAGQINSALEEEMPGVTISTSPVDRLLDAHSYSVNLVKQRPADHNRDDVKHSRKLCAQWLQSDGPRVCRCYLDETNYNIWCSRSFGRAAKGQPAVRTTTMTKGANFNIMALLATPPGMTKKKHRRSLLLDATRHSMQQIQRVDCAAFDRHNFSFVAAALRQDDL